MKKVFRLLGLLVLAIVIYYGFTTYPKLDLISGFSAKSVASGHYIDNRSIDMIEKGDNDINMIDLAKNEIDENSKYKSSQIQTEFYQTFVNNSTLF